MTLRTILLLIGIILIILILLDGLRRARRNKIASADSASSSANAAMQPALVSDAATAQQEDNETLNVSRESDSISIEAEKSGSTADQQAEDATTQNKIQAVKDESQLDLFKDVELDTTVTHETALAEEAKLENTANVTNAEPSKNFLILHVLAKPNDVFFGQQLFRALVRYGCRFGKGNLFHRYAGIDERSEIYFSIASAVQPGTFDVRKTSNFNTKGLVFFLRVEADKSVAFDLMLSTAKAIAVDLNGVLCDAKRQPFNEETLESYYERLAQYSC